MALWEQLTPEEKVRAVQRALAAKATPAPVAAPPPAMSMNALNPPQGDIPAPRMSPQATELETLGQERRQLTQPLPERSAKQALVESLLGRFSGRGSMAIPNQREADRLRRAQEVMARIQEVRGEPDRRLEGRRDAETAAMEREKAALDRRNVESQIEARQAPSAPKLVEIRNPDGSTSLVPERPGLQTAPAATPEPVGPPEFQAYSKDPEGYREWLEMKAKFEPESMTDFQRQWAQFASDPDQFREFYRARSGEGGTTEVEEEVEEAPLPFGETLWGQTDIRTTGPISSVRAGVGRVTGLFSETTKGRQDFDLARNDLTRSLSQNPRFPVGEMQRIEQATDIQPDWLTNPETLRTKLRGLDSYLEDRLRDQEEASQDSSLSQSDRNSARSNARAIRRFLRKLGVPGEQPEGENGGWKIIGVED